VCAIELKSCIPLSSERSLSLTYIRLCILLAIAHYYVLAVLYWNFYFYLACISVNKMASWAVQCIQLRRSSPSWLTLAHNPPTELSDKLLTGELEERSRNPAVVLISDCITVSCNGQRYIIAVADPDIRLGGHITWQIQAFRGGQFNVSQYLTFISSLEFGPKSVAKHRKWGMRGRIPSWIRHWISVWTANFWSSWHDLEWHYSRNFWPIYYRVANFYSFFLNVDIR